MKFRIPALALLSVLLAFSHGYGQTSGASFQESISQAATALTVNSSSSVVGLESPPTLSAVISFPSSGQTTGNVTFTVESGSTVIASGTAPVNLAGVATWTPSLPTGTFMIFAAYSGDSNLLGSTSPAISQTVLGPEDFSFSVSPFSVAQGQSAATPVSITAINGFHGAIAFSCASQSSEVDCGLSPNALMVPAPVAQTTTSASAGNVALSVTTFATTVQKAVLFGVFLLTFLTFNRRRLLALLAVATLALLMIGCGTGTRYVQQDGTPKGTYSITITGKSGTLSHSQTVLVTVR